MLPPRARHSISHAVIHFLVSLTATIMLLGASVAWGESPFRYQEVMVPMRDGVRLQTVILTPIGKKEPLPILLQRTPYGVPEKAPETIPPNLQELADLIARFKGRAGVSKLREVVSQRRTPTRGLLLALVVILCSVLVYSRYIRSQITHLRQVQADLVDRDRRDSLQLLRIQNNLNALALPSPKG